MRKNHTFPVLAILALVFTTVLASCSLAAPAAPQAQAAAVNAQNANSAPVLGAASVDLTEVDEEGNTSIDIATLQENLSSVTGSLSDAEIAGLLYMREEEKLARDVYQTLYEEWGMPIFQNIASSEQTHTDAVKTLLDTYGLEDPSAGKAIGEFANADLQALYTQLTALGKQSLGDALKVGATIEEIDILDLENNLAELDNPNIRTVYENLLKGSRNHLRSFVSTLSRQTGETYQPQYLSTDAFQAIVGSDMETGRNGSGGRGNRP